jgi:hypothetical protein
MRRVPAGSTHLAKKEHAVTSTCGSMFYPTQLLHKHADVTPKQSPLQLRLHKWSGNSTQCCTQERAWKPCSGPTNQRTKAPLGSRQLNMSSRADTKRPARPSNAMHTACRLQAMHAMIASDVTPVCAAVGKPLATAVPDNSICWDCS